MRLTFLASVHSILAISEARHRFTIGEAARWSYIDFVNGDPGFGMEGKCRQSIGKVCRLNWTGSSTRRLDMVPSVYEFRSPIGGNYPPIFDPSDWVGFRNRNHDSQGTTVGVPFLRVVDNPGGRPVGLSRGPEIKRIIAPKATFAPAR